MKHYCILLIFLGLLLASNDAAAKNYFWCTGYETSLTFPGDIIRFFSRDSLWGPIRSNDRMAFYTGGLPFFCADTIETSFDSSAYDWPLPECPIMFNVPLLHFPEQLSRIRARATEYSRFFHEESREWRGEIRDTLLVLFHYEEGTLFDSSLSERIDIPLGLGHSPFVFVDGELELKGTINPYHCDLVIGCGRDIHLIDDIMIEGTNPLNGELPAGATSRIAIASENWVYVANTPENGRENCNGDHSPGNHERCHIVITALVFAMRGSFQIDQMNDVNDPYISPVRPDERGNIVLTGGVTQWYRGYVHRSNLGGTGYAKVYHYDERLRHWRTGVFEPIDSEESEYTDAEETLFPSQFLLHVAPNPFNASTIIRFTLPTSSNVLAKAFDVQGREVARLTDQTYAAGNHVLQFDGSGLATGVYFLRLETLGQIQTRKLMLIK